MTTPSLAGPADVTRPGPRPYALARHSLALMQRSLVKTRRNPGVLMDALFMPMVFLLMFVYLFGGAIAGSRQDYLQGIFPGILVMATVLTGMLSTGVTINLDIKKGVFDRLRSMPIGRSAPLIGSVLGDLIRYVVSVGALFTLGYLIGFRVETGVASALAAVGLTVLFGFALSWIAVIVGVLVENPAGVQTVGFIGILPLAFGTDMVAPIDTMPGWLQAWADVNPMSSAMDAAERLLLGGSAAAAVVATLAWSAAFLVILVPLAIRVYLRRT